MTSKEMSARIVMERCDILGSYSWEGAQNIVFEQTEGDEV